MEVLELTPAVEGVRAKWRYRGLARPDFAEPTTGGEESVWDFPRPPRCEPVASRLRVADGANWVASTTAGVRILETAGAPTYYFPPDDVHLDWLLDLPGQSLCEWKGMATSFTLRDHKGDSRANGDSRAVGWRYDTTFPEFASIRGWCGFYAGVLNCFVGTEQVCPQAGDIYGGWVSENLKGPIKGAPGSEAW